MKQISVFTHWTDAFRSPWLSQNQNQLLVYRGPCLMQLFSLPSIFMKHFTASIHFTCHLWEILLHMTATTPLITICKPTPPARHWSLSHRISPSGRERRKVKSLGSECGDLWTLWPVHTWVSVCVTVCDSKGLTKECTKSARIIEPFVARSLQSNPPPTTTSCYQQPWPEQQSQAVVTSGDVWGHVLVILPC